MKIDILIKNNLKDVESKKLEIFPHETSILLKTLKNCDVDLKSLVNYKKYD